jgi:transposase-like protein
LNEECEEYKKINNWNMIRYGKTSKGRQRYQCKTCKKVFVETKETMFYRIRREKDEVIECMQMLGDRNSLAAIHRIKGVKEETVLKWLERARDHLERFESHIMKGLKLTRVQIDALWTFVGHKGEKGGRMKKKKKGHFGVEQVSILILA